MLAQGHACEPGNRNAGAGHRDQYHQPGNANAEAGLPAAKAATKPARANTPLAAGAICRQRLV